MPKEAEKWQRKGLKKLQMRIPNMKFFQSMLQDSETEISERNTMSELQRTGYRVFSKCLFTTKLFFPAAGRQNLPATPVYLMQNGGA